MANVIPYGFHHLADIFGQRVSDAGADVVDQAISQSMDEHRRQMDAFLPLFVQRTTAFKTVYRTPVRTRNQPLDEFGRPIPIKAAGKYEVGLPIQDSGNAMGFDWQAGLTMTVGEVARVVDTIQVGDFAWLFDHVLGALFNDSTYTYTDAEHGALDVLPIANGDSQVYNVQSGSDVGATDDHTLGQANTIGASGDNPFPALYTEITEHPENSGQVLTFIPSGLRQPTEALTGFYPVNDPNIRLGVSANQVVGTPGVTSPATLIGYAYGHWIYVFNRLPANYSITIMTGGDRPIAMRESESGALQGFVELPRNEDFPWYQRSWMRKAGFGAWNRVGAIVKRYGNATYAVPTGFDMPMA